MVPSEYRKKYARADLYCSLYSLSLALTTHQTITVTMTRMVDHS